MVFSKFVGIDFQRFLFQVLGLEINVPCLTFKGIGMNIHQFMIFKIENERIRFPISRVLRDAGPPSWEGAQPPASGGRIKGSNQHQKLTF